MQWRYSGLLVSAAFFKMVMEGRIARKIEHLDDETLTAIAGSVVPAEHTGLDEIIKDWTA